MGDVFGGAGGRRGGGVRKGADLRVRAPLTLAEVATGVRKTIRMKTLEPCTPCNGSGGADGAEPVRCDTCAGTGELRRVQRSFLGQMMTVAPCPTCGGEGQRIEQVCNACGGQGVQRGERTIEVDIPAGVSTGDYLTVRGSGNAAPRGGVRGDVLVVIEVAEDERFIRDGADLIHELPITFSQAALGADIEVPTIDGTARLKIAPGTQSGRLLRLRARGLPHLQGPGRGDMIVRIVVWTPTELTHDQEALFRRLAQVEHDAPEAVQGDAERGGFWRKVKEALGG
jgi:molecular chaperone DnaJ